MRYKEMPRFKKIYYAVMTAFTAIIMGVALNITTIISNAESAGKITATTCNVRADASTTSASIGSKSKDETIKILGQKTGADGYVWYQIYVNATTVGYVRSDLAVITDGSTPGNVGENGEGGETDAGVTAVNPVSGTVSGGQAVRVRQDASTSSTIVSSAASGTTLTVNGTKTGSDGRDWYYVEYTSDGKNIKGFIRSDFITLSGTLTPLTVESETPSTPDVEPTTDSTENTEPTTTSKPYDTVLEGDTWMLYDYAGGQKYDVASAIDIVKKYDSGAISEGKKGSKATVVFLIIFIILTLGAGAAAVYFFLKLREAGDKSAFADAERERKARANNKNGNGPSRPAGANGGARPAGANGGARPAGANGGARPAGANGGARPAGANGGARPAGANGGARPVGANGGARPTGGNGAVRPTAPNGAPRPTGTGAPRPAGSGAPRPAGVTRPVQGATRPVQSTGAPVRPNPQPVSRPAVDDDDEFEFGFLNWDGDDKK